MKAMRVGFANGEGITSTYGLVHRLIQFIKEILHRTESLSSELVL